MIGGPHHVRNYIEKAAALGRLRTIVVFTGTILPFSHAPPLLSTHIPLTLPSLSGNRSRR